MGAPLAIKYSFGISALLVFLGLYLSNSLIWVGLGVFLVTGLFLAISTRNFSWCYRNPFFFPTGLLSAAMALSVVLAAPYPFKGAIQKILMPFYLFLFAYVFDLFPKGKDTLVKCAVWLSAVGGLLGLTQSLGIFHAVLPGVNPYIFPLPHDPHLYLAVGLTRHHTTFAFTLIFLFHILLAQVLFSTKNCADRHLLIWGCVFSLVGIFFSFSRGAWLSLLVSTGLVFWLKNPKLFVKSLSVFGICSTGLYFFFPGFQHRIETLRLDANTERFELWKVGSKMFWNSPWFGQGYDSFGFRIGSFSDLPTTRPNIPLDLHNMYLEFLATSGLFGFSCFLFFLVFTYRFLLARLKESPWYLSSLGVMTSFAVGGAFDRFFDMPHTLLPVLLLLGVCSTEPK